MTYFLHYNNAIPLFVGGHAHGQKMPVGPHHRYYRVTWHEPLNLRVAPDVSYEAMPALNIDTYRRERFRANGRDFYIFIEESLTPDAAMMLMFQTVSESPDLKIRCRVAEERVRQLEQEVAILKSLVLQAITDVDP